MNWPAGNQSARFGDILKPLREAFLFGFTLRRKNEDKDLPWDGLPQGPLTNVTCLEPADALTAKNLAYSLDDQGRDLLDELLALAVQLGVEQGRRVYLSSTASALLVLRLGRARDGLLDALEELGEKP